MGAFLYSNTKISTESIVKVFKSRGHQIIKDRSNKSITLVTAPKIIIRNSNYLDRTSLGGNNDDFALGIGTFFYKGKYGEDALRLIYNDLDVVLRDNPVYGHWAFCIHKGEATYIFNDMSGFLRLYYYEEEGKIIVSSSMLAVLSTIQCPKFDERKIGGFVAGHYGRETTFVEGMEIVDPRKYLVITDKGLFRWEKRNEPKVERIERLDEAKILVKRLFEEQIEALKPALREQTVYMDATGGLDSRLVSAVLKWGGIKYDYLNYPIFGPDAEIAKILAMGQNIKLQFQTNISISDDIEKHLGEFDYGNNFFRQYPNPRWHMDNDFEFSGARGECIDLPDIYSDEDLSFMEDTRPEVLINRLTTNPIMTENNRTLYVNYLKDLLKDRFGLDSSQKLTEKQQVLFTQLFAGQFGDSLYNSGAQSHVYFYQLFNEWHFNHFIADISFEAKKCRKLTIALIKEISPELASFPFVSRRRTKRNSVMEVSELPMKYKNYNGIKALIPKRVLNYLYKKIGRCFPKSRMTYIDFSRYKNVFNVKELMNYPNLYSDILNRLFSVEVIRKYFNIQ